MPTRTISEEQYESLRVAACLVYKNEKDLEDKSPEVNKPDAKAGSANVKGKAKAKASFEKGMPSANVNEEEEEIFENGIELLASVAAKFKAEGDKKKN